MVKKFFLQLKLTLLACFICFTAMAHAEEIDDFFALSPIELANISVSIATGTPKPAYQSAAVTSVITAEQIKSMGATELCDVLDTVPGLHVSIQPVTGDPLYSMRGIRNDLNSEILLLLNGARYVVPYNGGFMTGMSIPVEAIQKIEVIRGPGSALYGANAFAGVINIITKKAQDIAGTEIGIRGGSWDTQSAWGLHGNHWQGWDIATTLQYSHNNNDGNRIITADAQSALDTTFGSKASLAPGEIQTQTERWNAHLNLHRKHLDIDFWAFKNVDGKLRAGIGTLDNKGSLKGENYLTNLSFSTEDLIENLELNVNANYLYTNIAANLYHLPDRALAPIDNIGNINLSSPTGLVFFPNGMRTQLGIENQVAALEISSLFKGIENHLIRLSTSFRYEQVHTKESRNHGIGIINGTQSIVDGKLTDITGTDLASLENTSRSIWSVALQDEWQLSDNWHLTTGIRYDEYSDFGSTFNPRAALVWTINDQLSSKLLYGRAFRAPSFLEQKQKNSQLFEGNPNITPEIINTAELAFDYHPHHNFRSSINFYFYEIDDVISTVTIDQNISQIRNQEGQSGYGSELEWDWQFYKQWNLKGNYAWQNSHSDKSGNRISKVPEHQIYVAASWRFLPKWQLQTQLNWIGNRTSPKGDNRVLKDYETVDITLSSQRFFGHIDFTASARNIFNSHGKEYASRVYSDNMPIASRSFYLETTLHF
ncbi:MAG: TonB-dependent receptor [Methylococcales bacterium]|nr:TonB-dependent receptor [Methylococcales bacterium]